MKVLILAPHTDDAEFGCGGTIARLVEEGHDVHCAVFSACMLSVPDGFPKDQLITEVKAASAVLGIRPERLDLHDFRVRTFDRHRQEILDALIKLRERIKPAMVLMPWVGDVHQDHRVIAEEATRAFKHCTLLSYELPWNCIDPFPADQYIELSLEQLDRKREAIRCYRTQAQRPYASRAYMKNQALARGMQAGLPLAEVFHTVRMIYAITT